MLPRPDGPDPEADSRDAVGRTHDRADGSSQGEGGRLIVYPELALTRSFTLVHDGSIEVDACSSARCEWATRPLFERAAKHQIAMNFGYAELTPDGHHFNTAS